MIPSFQSVNTSVLPQSKKISKNNKILPRQSVKECLDLDLESGYITFLPEEKREILNSIKRQLLILQGLDSTKIESEIRKDSGYWLSVVKVAGAKSLNQVLKNLIPKYRPDLALTVPELTNLRKKIKGWLNSEGITEKRGDPMIRDEELPKFKEILRKVMKVRNFDELRKDVLPYVRKIRIDAGRKFEESMFSKKFWSTFLNKEENSDMKELWESLPFLNGKVSQKMREAKKMRKNSESSVHDSEAETEKTKPEEDLTEGSVFPEQTEQGFWFADSHVQDYLDNFDENEMKFFGDNFVFNAEISDSTLASAEELKPMETEDKPQPNFLEDFWSAWNDRSSADHNNDVDFSMIGKYVQLPESKESVQRVEHKPFDDNANNFGFFGASQDSYKQASFSAWK